MPVAEKQFDGNQIPKRRPGRPEQKVWPEPIDDSAEEVVRALMQAAQGGLAVPSRGQEVTNGN